MRKQDHLVQLVHSLSPSEKKYFRQYISARHDSKDYEKLFDILLRSEIYDADAISLALKKSKKNLADDKEYLQEILLRSLQNFHANSIYRARCFNALIEAEILAGKGLAAFALAQIRKQKKTMLPGEENLLYYMMIAQETNLVKMTTPGGLKANDVVKSNGEDIINRIEAILLYNKMVKISIEMLDLSADIKYILSPSVQKKAIALVQQAHELTRGKKLSSLIYTTYHTMLAEYYLFLGIDTKLSIQHLKKAIHRFESETEAYRQFYKRDYYLKYADLMQGYFELKDYKNVEICLQKISNMSLGNISKQLQNRADRLVFRHTVMNYTAQGKYEEALTHIHSHMPAYIRMMPGIEDLSVVELFKVINYFHQQKYNEALKALLPLLSSDAPAQLPETRITARALNLMIQYEIGNQESLPDYLRASNRFFKKEKLMTKEVQLFLELMQQLSKYGIKTPVMEYQKRLEDVYASHRFELIGHFVLLPWLRRFPRRSLR